jgi:hypothetical protein
MIAVVAAVRGTPLCHFVTSPPQGGRVGTHALLHSICKPLNLRDEVGESLLSPRVGEMPGRAEGGNPNPTRSST